MKAQIRLHVIAIHTKHSFVQHPFLTFKDDAEYSIHQKICEFLDSRGLTDFYRNHLSFECVDYNGNPIYVGYNDGKLSFGHTIGSLMDSKTIMGPTDGMWFLSL